MVGGLCHLGKSSVPNNDNGERPVSMTSDYSAILNFPYTDLPDFYD